MSDSDPRSIYEVVGEHGLRRMVNAFYQRVPSDDILGPMYPQGELAEAERRLADFLIYRFGGPDHYVQERGNPMLRMRHAAFPISQAARDRWVRLMDEALEESAWPGEVVSTARLFLHDAATFLINR